MEVYPLPLNYLPAGARIYYVDALPDQGLPPYPDLLSDGDVYVVSTGGYYYVVSGLLRISPPRLGSGLNAIPLFSTPGNSNDVIQSFCDSIGYIAWDTDITSAIALWLQQYRFTDSQVRLALSFRTDPWGNLISQEYIDGLVAAFDLANTNWPNGLLKPL